MIEEVLEQDLVEMVKHLMIIEALVHHLPQWELLLLQTVVPAGGGTCIWLMIATAPKDLVDLEEEELAD